MNPPATTPAGPAKSRILVVDDITRNLQIVGTVLRDQGYAVMPATSGVQALERVRAQPPDLILLDLMMPEMDGIEVCRRLKADSLTQQIPVIFLTASNEMEHLVRGFEAGAVDYVTKPFNTPELLARVRTHLELKHARERLRQMNDEKNEFMGIAAHDLRNPLTSIEGFSEVLCDDAELTPAELRDYAGRIRDSARRMREMVQNLLDANRIERGEMQLSPSPTDLGPVLESVVAAFRPRAIAKNQTLHLEAAASKAVAMVDRNVVVQVLENLVSNAVKYSPTGRNIWIRLEGSGSAVRCEVEDEGPGLSAEDMKKLFGKFARLSAKPTGGEQATGLGLSIVKQMVEALHGRIWCESQPGQGARFIVEFPPAAGLSDTNPAVTSR